MYLQRLGRWSQRFPVRCMSEGTREFKYHVKDVDRSHYKSNEVLSKMRGEPMSMSKTFVPEGFQRRTLRHRETLSVFKFIVRDVDIQLSAELDGMVKDNTVDKPGKCIILDGPKAIGKSVTMARLVEQRRKSGWLVFFITDSHRWTMGDGFYTPAYENETARLNNEEPLWYDRPLHARKLLRKFDKAHRPLLKRLPIKHTNMEPQKASGAKHISDLIDYAVKLYERLDEDWFHIPKQIGEVLQAVIEEVLSVTDVPVLVALDSIDACFGLSALKDNRGSYILSQSIRLVSNFRDPSAFAKRIQNGAFVTSRSVRDKYYPVMKDVRKKGFKPTQIAPLDERSIKMLKVDPVDLRYVKSLCRKDTQKIPAFDLHEFTSLMKLIREQGIVEESFTPEKIEYLHSLTCGRPEELLTICRSL